VVTLLAWGTALLASTVAALCAAADGAMLALDPDEPLPPDLRALHERRERTHRAVAFARVMAQLTGGVSVAVALDLAARSRREALFIGLLAALLLVGLTESLARSTGSVGGERTARRLYGFIRTVEHLLKPIAALGGWIDATLQRLLPPPSDSEEEREATAEQFMQVVAAEAEVSKEERGLLNSVFRLGDTEVHELMVPRADMVGLDVCLHVGEIVSAALDRPTPDLSGSLTAMLPLLTLYEFPSRPLRSRLCARRWLQCQLCFGRPRDWETKCKGS